MFSGKNWVFSAPLGIDLATSKAWFKATATGLRPGSCTKQGRIPY
jgi:hypothetical protein